MLLSLLVLPLFVPVLVFGAGAVEAQASGLGAQAHFSILMAMLLPAAFFSPLACAAAVRMAAENATLKKGAEVLDVAPGCT